jgi:carbon monoxide dehydrogenase subunit G
MPAFHEEIEVAAHPDQAWEVLGDLRSVEHWSPGVTAVQVDGMTRVCTFEGGHVQHEQISDYSPETRSYNYSIEGGLPVKHNRGRFAVESSAGGSRIVWDSSFEPLDPATERELAEMWGGALPSILAGLKALIERR